LTSGLDNGWNNRRFYKGAIVGSVFVLGGAGVGKALAKAYESVEPPGAQLVCQSSLEAQPDDAETRLQTAPPRASKPSP
jgi:hypothetical protein